MNDKEYYFQKMNVFFFFHNWDFVCCVEDQYTDISTCTQFWTYILQNLKSHVSLLFFKVIPVTFQLKIWKQIFLKRLSSTNIFTCWSAVTYGPPVHWIACTLHIQICNLSQHSNKVIRKTGLPQPKMLQSAHNSDRERHDQGVVFFRKQFY